MPRDLSRLLRPRSIALIGGGAWGANIVEQCRRMGFSGPVWPVHPSRPEIGGLPTVPYIESLPEAPDAAFIAINRHLSIEAVAALAARGAGGAVCFASGFAEAETELGDGAALQARLVEAAGDMPILGPNCYGLINYLDGAVLWPDQHGGRPVERGVGIVTQSSNILINITMQARGLPVAFCVAAGNQAQTGLAEIARAMIADERVSAIGLHIEGLGDVRAFEAMAADARAAGKPVVALRVGRTEQSRAAALSHTASLVGDAAAARAFLARLGIAEVASLPAFLETLKLLHVHGPLPGGALGSLSCSGGEASLIADAAAGRSVAFRPLAAEERARVSATLGPRVHVANPLDYHTYVWNDVPAMTATYAAMLGCGFDLCFLVLDFPRTDRCSDAAWECAVTAITAAQAATGARVAVVATLPETLPEARADAFLAAGICPLGGLDEALSAAEAAAAIGRAWAAPAPAPVLHGTARTADGGRLLDERTAKLALAVHGVPVPAGRVAANVAEAVAAAREIGLPVALKALGVAHKTEHAAIRLDLREAAEVEAAAQSMAAPDGFLVEAMVAGGVAELLVGVLLDPPHGFTLTLAAGGVMTEILADSATLMIPATEAEVRAALAGLRMAPLLAGFRGKAPADLDAAVAAVMAVQRFAEAEAGRLVELDINPLILTPRGAVAADALIRLGD